MKTVFRVLGGLCVGAFGVMGIMGYPFNALRVGLLVIGIVFWIVCLAIPKGDREKD